jgi:D-alanine-D-alanine ligase
MKPPYVVKPVSEGSSFGVVIVKEDQSHPPQMISLRSGVTATR